MADKTLNTRIVLCNDTTVNWGSSDKVLLKGEVAIELTSGAPKVKIGDGVKTFADLPYVTMTPTEITNAIQGSVTAASHTHSNKAILDQITAALTTTLKSNYDTAYTHSQSAHAPSGAQANVIEKINVNGTQLVPSSKTVNITVPTKVSDLNNDAGYQTENTTYDLSATKGSTNGNVAIKLAGSDGTTDSVTVKGGGSATVTTDSNGNIIVNATDTKYTHPNSGVTAGTYKSVTVNAQGHVTAGTNPTTLSGYGITDAASKIHQHNSADINSLDASKLTGTIDIARLPQGALERCVIVENDEARFGLTTSDVQKGDTVKVESTGKMYFIVDDANLDSEDGYEIYTAGTATSVPWSGITGKPSTFTPSTHTHSTSQISGLDDALDGKATSAQGAKADTAVQSVKISGSSTEYKSGTAVTLPAYPTTLPASDVSAWAKASTKPSYTKSEVGLGNLTNDRQVKGLSSGTTSGHVVTWGSDGYTVTDSGFTIKTSVPANAKFTDTTYGIAGSSLGLVKTASGTNKVAVSSSDGTMSVSAISTDIFTQGSNTLILNGGGAA